MTAGSRRQAAMLVALLVALAVVLYLRRGETPPATGVPTASNPAAAGGAATSAAGQAAVADVRLEALRADRGDLAPPDRNPFRFGQRTPEPAEPGEAPAPRPQRVAPAEPARPAGPPPPPPIPLKFIGVLEAPTRIGTVAILSDSRGNVFYGKEGDIIEGRYKVLKIGADSAELSYVDGRGRQTIRMSGQ